MAPNAPKPRVEDLKTNFSPRNIDLIANNNQAADSPLKVQRNTVYEQPRVSAHYNSSPVRQRSNSVTLNSSRLPELIDGASPRKRSIKKTTEISDIKNKTEVKRTEFVLDQGQQYRTEESEEDQ